MKFLWHPISCTATKVQFSYFRCSELITLSHMLHVLSRKGLVICLVQVMHLCKNQIRWRQTNKVSPYCPVEMLFPPKYFGYLQMDMCHFFPAVCFHFNTFNIFKSKRSWTKVVWFWSKNLAKNEKWLISIILYLFIKYLPFFSLHSLWNLNILNGSPCIYKCHDVGTVHNPNYTDELYTKIMQIIWVQIHKKHSKLQNNILCSNHLTA